MLIRLHNYKCPTYLTFGVDDYWIILKHSMIKSIKFNLYITLFLFHNLLNTLLKNVITKGNL